MNQRDLRRLFDRIARLSAPLPLALVAMDCGSDHCSPIPCPAPGWDSETCHCRPPITPELDGWTVDASTATDSGTTTNTDDATNAADGADLSEATADAEVQLDPCGGDGGPPRGGVSCHAACVFTGPSPFLFASDGGFSGQPCADICGPEFGGGLARCELVHLSDDQAIVRCQPDCTGRRPAGLVENQAPSSADAREHSLGDYFAEMAYFEAASIEAFRVLAGELRRRRAPARLVRAARRAARDELRHARLARALARRHRSPATLPEVAPLGPRSLEAMALENAVQGCVRETWGALVAVHQSHAARDPHVRAAMARVARDEIQHAALSWRVDAWLHGRLSPAARRRVAESKQAAFTRVAADAATTPSDALKAAGAPTRERALVMLADLQRALGAA